MPSDDADFDPACHPDLDPVAYRRLMQMMDDAIAVAERDTVEAIASLRQSDARLARLQLIDAATLQRWSAELDALEAKRARRRKVEAARAAAWRAHEAAS
jgi:hypothetical protein